MNENKKTRVVIYFFSLDALIAHSNVTECGKKISFFPRVFGPTEFIASKSPPGPCLRVRSLTTGNFGHRFK